MTAKQILDSFSETLIQDERILSAQERALLTTLLQHARSASDGNPETQEKVRAIIASAVGETVAQRAFSVLGASMVERILEGNMSSAANPVQLRTAEIYAGAPQPPSGAPQPPAQVPRPGEPQPPTDSPRRAPQPPSQVPRPGEPQPPSGPGPTSQTRVAVSQSDVSVVERPLVLPAKCVVLDEFLAPQELEELTTFTLLHESNFSTSTVISPTAEGGVANYEHRRSRVLMDLAQYQDLMLDRVRAVMPQVAEKLGLEDFSVSEIEAQMTASNDGDFFRCHSDNGNERVASRQLTFVYFFHREPRQFEGGELRIHDARLEVGTYVSEGTYHTITPQQNQIVFFPCELLHEITPVKCPSQLFADSRFTMNGWLRR